MLFPVTMIVTNSFKHFPESKYQNLQKVLFRHCSIGNHIMLLLLCLWRLPLEIALILEIDVQLKRKSMEQESEIIVIESGDGIAFYKVRPGECEFS